MGDNSKKYGVMRRLMSSDGDVRVGRDHIYHEDAKPVASDMGLIRHSIWDLPLPACPDCGGEVVWAEAGLVPGARECTACGSRFTVETWEQPERLESLAQKWGKARGKIADYKITTFDSVHSLEMGLPVLAALLQFEKRLLTANGYIGRSEIMAELSPIIQLARGEAQRRASAIGAEISIPGLASIPMGDVL